MLENLRVITNWGRAGLIQKQVFVEGRAARRLVLVLITTHLTVRQITTHVTV